MTEVLTDADIVATTRLVLTLGFAVAVAFGAIAQRTHFCTMGAMADLAVTGDSTRLRMWALAAGAAIIGFNLMVAFDLVRAADSIYAAPRITWASAIVGGLMFGVGMVLASGCTSKNLMRAGGGSLKALVVLLVVAFAGFATLKGLTAVLRVETVDKVFLTLDGGQDLPSLIGRITGVSAPVLAGVLGIVLGGALLVAALSSRSARSLEVVGGGLALGGLIVAAWWVSGVLGYVAEHPATLERAFLATNSHRMESMTFVSATSYTADYLLFFSDRSKTLTLGIVFAAGLVVGAAIHSVASGTFRWEGFGGVADLRNHLLGGALMGVGGVTALGCTIGQGLSGVATLGVTSFIALAAMMGGAYATVKVQMWRLEHDDASDVGSSGSVPSARLDSARL